MKKPNYDISRHQSATYVPT